MPLAKSHPEVELYAEAYAEVDVDETPQVLLGK
jgi:hypothetical protein